MSEETKSDEFSIVAIDIYGRVSIPKDFRVRNNLEPENKWALTKSVEITLEYGLICIRPYTTTDLTKRQYVGVVRALDRIGRACIPKEYRELLGIHEKDQERMSMKVLEDVIYLQKI